MQVVELWRSHVVENLRAHWESPVSSYAAALARDELPPAVVAAFDLLRDDVEWINPMRERYVGKLACARYADELVGALGDYSIKLGSLDDLGGHVLLSEHLVEAMGASSGVPTSFPVFTLFTVREGLIARMDEFTTRDGALGAARPK